MLLIWSMPWWNASFTINAFRPSHQLYWFHFMQLPICSHASICLSFSFRLLNINIYTYKAGKSTEHEREWVWALFLKWLDSSKKRKAGYCIHWVMYSRINLVKASAIPCPFSCISFYFFRKKYVCRCSAMLCREKATEIT